MSSFSILLVDDNRDLLDGIELVLEAEGYHTDVAYSGGEATKKFASHCYDLVLIDIKLDDMNGMFLYYSLHKERPQSTLVLMSGYRIDQALKLLMDQENIPIVYPQNSQDKLVHAVRELGNDGIGLVLLDKKDTPGTVELLAAILEQSGKSPMIVDSVQDAIDQILENKPDILLLAHHEPLFCFLDLYYQIKEHYIPLPMLLFHTDSSVSNYSTQTVRDVLQTHYLTKPFRVEQLLDLVKNLESEARHGPH